MPCGYQNPLLFSFSYIPPKFLYLPISGESQDLGPTEFIVLFCALENLKTVSVVANCNAKIREAPSSWPLLDRVYEKDVSILVTQVT